MNDNRTVGESLEDQIPNFKSDLTQDVTYSFVAMIGQHPNEITLVVIGHFLVEHLLNQIILSKCKNPNKIINFTFAIKTEILDSMGLLPDDIYKNISKLNSIRNKVVHTLKANLIEKDMVFYKSDGSIITIKIPKNKNPEKFYLQTLIGGVLVPLRNHMLTNLKISPNYSIVS